MLVDKMFKADVAIEDIWSVSYKKGDYHSPHNHGTIGYAGILYLDFPEGSQTNKLYTTMFLDILVIQDCSIL